jgi:hypothetical protein
MLIGTLFLFENSDKICNFVKVGQAKKLKTAPLFTF